LPLPPRRAHATGEVFLGDALAMIPPISGNGMSMALESAAIAWPPLVDYSRGSVSWNGTVALIAAELNRRFASRLVWAQWLQRLLLSPAVSAPFAGWLLSSNCLFRLFLRKTR
jgi:2-polyprenyl-6-methoxyphenol hydroxylase-like FAD-dependent oxidoreductase